MSEIDEVNNLTYLKKLYDIGVALSEEHDLDRLLELIVKEAKEMASADWGILYLYQEGDRTLEFSIMYCDSLNLHYTRKGDRAPFSPVQVYNHINEENHAKVVSHALHMGAAINIADVYSPDEGHDFSETKDLDNEVGYKTQSLLAVPLKQRKTGRPLGVLCLSNAQDGSAKTVSFNEDRQHAVESLASQAAVALDNYYLHHAQEELSEAFIKLLSTAVDLKSSEGTGERSSRIPDLVEKLGELVCNDTDGPFSDVSFNEEEWHELRIAAWLHDCAKLTIPEQIIKKRTKLEATTDRMEVVSLRMDLILRDAEIHSLRESVAVYQKGEGNPDMRLRQLEAEYQHLKQQLQNDHGVLKMSNQSKEFLPQSTVEDIQRIAGRYQWTPVLGIPEPDQKPMALLNAEEFENLCVQKGNLTDKERNTIIEHNRQLDQMIQSLPLPDYLQNVALYANARFNSNQKEHATISDPVIERKKDGSTVTNLSPTASAGKRELTPQEHIMVMADIFAALTDPECSYRAPKTLNQAFEIMKELKESGFLHPRLFELFLNNKDAYSDYAQKHLKDHQLDDVCVETISKVIW